MIDVYKRQIQETERLPVIAHYNYTLRFRDVYKRQPVRETYYKGNERIDEVTHKYALLSTHAGRRTFICNALARGIPAQVVMKWTGHSDYKAMKPYIDIADDIKGLKQPPRQLPKQARQNRT